MNYEVVWSDWEMVNGIRRRHQLGVAGAVSRLAPDRASKVDKDNGLSNRGAKELCEFQARGGNPELPKTVGKYTLIYGPYLYVRQGAKGGKYVDVRCECGVVKRMTVSEWRNGAAASCKACYRKTARADPATTVW